MLAYGWIPAFAGIMGWCPFKIIKNWIPSFGS
jgi:hypothetical protein